MRATPEMIRGWRIFAAKPYMLHPIVLELLACVEGAEERIAVLEEQLDEMERKKDLAVWTLKKWTEEQNV